MNKILILIHLLFFISVSSSGQLAAWDLLINGNSTQVAANVTAGNFTGGSGISTVTFGVNGATATSWSTGTIDTTNYFEINIAPVPGYKLTIQALNFAERRSLTGIHTYEVQYSTNAAFTSPVTLITVNVPDDDLERAGNITGLNIVVNSGDTLYVRWYGYAAEGSTGSWRINDTTLKVFGQVTPANTNNNDSYIQNPASQISAGNISSVSTSSGLAVPFFKANVADAASGDGLPTKITLITLKNQNPVNGADWTNSIQGVLLSDGINPVTIQQTSILTNSITLTVNSGDLLISDGSSSDLTFYVYLNANNLVDTSTIQCYIDHLNSGWDTDISGSGFLPAFSSDIVSNVLTIDVQATRIQFTAIPQTVWTNQNFSVSAVVTDINNNTDLDGSQQVTLQKTIGTGTLASSAGLTRTLTGGEATWTDLTYDISGYFSITLSEQTSSLTPVTSGLINCSPTGQVLNESFNDGDFSNNPAWFGETGDFIITPELQLQLFTTSATDDTSCLYTPVFLTTDSLEWQAYVKIDLNPSASNKTRYYLLSNNENFKSPLQGYFLNFGESTTPDAVELFYQNNQTITSVCRGTDGLIDTLPSVRVKVIRTSTGIWRLYVDPSGGSSFELQATGTDSSFYQTGFYTGVFCRYTSSNDEGKFSFDDFYCGPVQIDTVPPAFVDLSVVDSLHIDLNFTEGISLSTAQNTANYFVDNSIGNPSAVVRDATDYKKIHLTFSTPFVTGTTYTITVSGLKDFSNNNILMPVVNQFIWYRALPFDVQINEIMADPTPVLGLPDAEYIELFNRSAYNIDLTKWTLTIDDNTVVFPSAVIPANDYLILCSQTAQTSLETYGNTLGIISSSSAITNAGVAVILRNKEGETISLTEFSDSWYGNNNKEDGGWSLEQIDPLNPCGEDANWTASNDAAGGTPGRINSVYRPNADNIKPELLRAILTLPDTLLLTFSETIFVNDTVLNVADFTVNHGIGLPVSAVFKDMAKKKAILVFNQTFVKDTVYEVTVSGQLKDCAGNLISTSYKAQFAIPDTVIPGSFIINEVLFNPFTGGDDYIELFNNSSGIYNLKDVRLYVAEDNSIYEIAPEGFYLFPGDYAVLTINTNNVCSFYSCPGKKAFVKINDMPSYNNSEGRVTVINRSFQIIDDLSYNESMQFQLLNSFQGVALERIHPELLTQDTKNWHSASENSGFGTPGYKNSQYAQFENNEMQIVIEPEVFSPDNDGHNDILNIRYKFDNPGFVANVTIFDSKGRKIKSLISNEMLGTEGYFTWDGLNDGNQKASIGIYVIFVEIFNMNGKTGHFKRTCVLAGHLN